MKPAHYFLVQPWLPQALQPLKEIAQNLYHRPYLETYALFEKLNPESWEKFGRNPLLFLRSLPSEDLLRAAGDPNYLEQLDRVRRTYQEYLQKPSEWASANNPPDQAVIDRMTIDRMTIDRTVIAFFSAEFGIASHLPNYSGGLGVLAGDYLKSASDLGLPLVGIGLLYRQGYFKQVIDVQGWQREIYPDYNLNDYALELVRDGQGKPITVSLNFPDRQVLIQAWQAKVGRLNLYLLDCNCEGNWEGDRNITDRLYGGDTEKRIQQEIILGIGGMRFLAALGTEAVVCHMNEGHSAFLALERIRRSMETHRLDFDSARELAAGGNVFTTHTPVAAGIDVFQPYLMDKYFTGYYQSLGLTRQEFMSLGRIDPLNQQELFNMAVLALRLANRTNGVSRLHGVTARRMWQRCWPGLAVEEIPIGSITNGVHATTWVGPHLAPLYDKYLGSGWTLRPMNSESWAGVSTLPDEELWQAHESARAVLVSLARKRFGERMKNWGMGPLEQENAGGILNPRALTIGFARRFATYKRPTLLFRFPERLIRLLQDRRRPVQIIFSGKAHPSDDEGKRLIQQIIAYSGRPDFQAQIAFLEDYDMDTAATLIQGVDLWLGNPRRPLEASSTSGMKAVLNGALHLHTMDGWWDEAWNPSAGWAIGSNEESGNPEYQDQIEAESLFNLLEKEIIPLFYDRDERGLPLGWLAKMKCSMQTYGPLFNTHRMVEEYNRQFYLPAIELFRRLEAEGQQGAQNLARWKQRIRAAWGGLAVEKVADNVGDQTIFSNDCLKVQAWICLGNLKPEEVKVEVYYGLVDSEGNLQAGRSTVLNPLQALDDGRYLYRGEAECRMSGRYGYNIRILPSHRDLSHPYIPGLIHWD